MNYRGKLYARIGGKYIEMEYDSAQFESMEQTCADKQAEIEHIRVSLLDLAKVAVNKQAEYEANISSASVSLLAMKVKRDRANAEYEELKARAESLLCEMKNIKDYKFGASFDESNIKFLADRAINEYESIDKGK